MRRDSRVEVPGHILETVHGQDQQSFFRCQNVCGVDSTQKRRHTPLLPYTPDQHSFLYQMVPENQYPCG